MFLQVGAALGVRPVNLHWLVRRGQPRCQKSFGTASADRGQSRVLENALQQLMRVVIQLSATLPQVFRPGDRRHDAVLFLLCLRLTRVVPFQVFLDVPLPDTQTGLSARFERFPS